MHAQLAEVTEILHEGGVPYWLDSGTLLGVIREGGVMEHDKDIDLGIWAEDEDKLRAVFDQFEMAGYRIIQYRYGQLPYSFVLKPGGGEGITVAIGVYRRSGDRAWRLATYVADNPYPRWGVRFLALGAIRFPLRQIVRILMRRIPRAQLVAIWPFKLVVGAGIWLIPGVYLEEIIRHKPTGLPIPAKWDDYLTYRYGNWRKPVKDWVWYRDDGAAHIGDPNRLIQHAVNEGFHDKG